MPHSRRQTGREPGLLRFAVPALILTAIALLALALATPWWTFSIRYPDAQYHTWHGLFGECTTGPVGDWPCWRSEALQGAVLLVVGGLASSALQLVFATWGRIRGRSLALQRLTGAVSSALALAAPVAASIILPHAVGDQRVAGFWGSYTLYEGAVVVSYGADVGWYAAIAASALSIVTLALLWRGTPRQASPNC